MLEAASRMLGWKMEVAKMEFERWELKGGSWKLEVVGAAGSWKLGAEVES